MNISSATQNNEVNANAVAYKQYACITCDLTYDEAQGWPEEGFPAGTLWQDIPDDWTCPDCSASKDDFYLVEN